MANFSQNICLKANGRERMQHPGTSCMATKPLSALTDVSPPLFSISIITAINAHQCQCVKLTCIHSVFSWHACCVPLCTSELPDHVCVCVCAVYIVQLSTSFIQTNALISSFCSLAVSQFHTVHGWIEDIDKQKQRQQQQQENNGKGKTHAHSSEMKG